MLANPTAFEADLIARAGAAAPGLAARGLPNRRMEAWRWSDVRAAVRAAPTSTTTSARGATGADVSPGAFAEAAPFVVSWADGRPFWENDAPAGMSLRVLDGDDAGATIDHPTAELTRAFARATLVLDVEPGAEITRPILLKRTGAGGEAYGRVALSLGSGARAHVIEAFDMRGDAFVGHWLDARIASDGELYRDVVQTGDEAAALLALATATLADGARFEQTTLAFGGRLTRLETRLAFAGEGAAARLNGANLVSGARHADQTSHIVHGAPGCETRQLYKSVAAERGRAVFQGKFLVERAGQQTDAQMTANALLLSETAEANHKPELEIYADDVECAHGSTAGALDDAALFYMRQRGLSDAEARRILIEAFVAEAFDAPAHEAVGEALRAQVAGWLEAEGAAR